jgi:hypothetical protein
LAAAATRRRLVDGGSGGAPAGGDGAFTLAGTAREYARVLKSAGLQPAPPAKEGVPPGWSAARLRA